MIQVLSVEMSATQGLRTFAASSGNRASNHVGSLTMKKSRALPCAPARVPISTVDPSAKRQASLISQPGNAGSDSQSSVRGIARGARARTDGFRKQV